MATTDHVPSECLRQQKLKKEEEQEETLSWKDRPLHGMYCQQTKDVTYTEKSY